MTYVEGPVSREKVVMKIGRLMSGWIFARNTVYVIGHTTNLRLTRTATAACTRCGEFRSRSAGCIRWTLDPESTALRPGTKIQEFFTFSRPIPDSLLSPDRIHISQCRKRFWILVENNGIGTVCQCRTTLALFVSSNATKRSAVLPKLPAHSAADFSLPVLPARPILSQKSLAASAQPPSRSQNPVWKTGEKLQQNSTHVPILTRGEKKPPNYTDRFTSTMWPRPARGFVRSWWRPQTARPCRPTQRGAFASRAAGSRRQLSPRRCAWLPEKRRSSSTVAMSSSSSYFLTNSCQARPCTRSGTDSN